MNTDKENLVNTPGIWKLIKQDDQILAGVLYRNHHGRKIRLIFHNGTCLGKQKVRTILQTDVTYGRSWVEASGPVEKCLLTLGARLIPNSKAQTLLGTRILKLDNDGYHYEREVCPGIIKRQILVGQYSLMQDIKELKRE